MKWRHWSILIILVLLNYIIFSTAFTQLAKQRLPGPRFTRTPQPTFESVDPSPVAWIVLPTSTPRPTRTPVTPTPTPIVVITPTMAITVTVQPATTTAPTPPPPTTTPLPATATSLPATATPAGQEAVIHSVRRGETLSQIAKDYGVPMQAIVDANNLENPNRIVTGQKLTVPLSGAVIPTVTARAQATRTPTARPATPKPTQKPPTATPSPAASSLRFTGEVIWDPLVAPNCSGPAISKHSVIRDANGNPVNGVRVEVDCYGNTWYSHPSGNPGEYDPGHYDFSFGQSSPQDWTCTARVFDIDSQPVTSSQTITIHFDTNDCRPHGDGHQVAIVNWTKHW